MRHVQLGAQAALIALIAQPAILAIITTWTEALVLSAISPLQNSSTPPTILLPAISVLLDARPALIPPPAQLVPLALILSEAAAVTLKVVLITVWSVPLLVVVPHVMCQVATI